MPFPGIEPGSARPQRAVLTTILEWQTPKNRDLTQHYIVFRQSRISDSRIPYD